MHYEESPAPPDLAPHVRRFWSLRDEPELPELIEDALLADFERLNAPTKAVVRCAAAARRAVSPAVLSAAVPLPHAEVVEALREAVDHEVLIPDRASGSYRFRHALIAEAAYATLLPGEGEGVHERLAQAPLGFGPAALIDEQLGAHARVLRAFAHFWIPRYVSTSS